MDGRRKLQLTDFMIDVSLDPTLHHRAVRSVSEALARSKAAHTEIEATHDELEVPIAITRLAEGFATRHSPATTT